MSILLPGLRVGSTPVPAGLGSVMAREGQLLRDMAPGDQLGLCRSGCFTASSELPEHSYQAPGFPMSCHFARPVDGFSPS